ncbi:hypothetical protein ABID52_001918 [Fictibacillus halophilus]|uniref:Bacitracin ABC transporter ATP-binding protein n=1 Tax=Fictibacillus halophilus TaxID=1610490 RepID=A0ABV2LIC4_9BACL|nr:hypothetical protein [Fictibacillus halophilus]
MAKQKNPLFSDEYLTNLAQEINEQYGDTEQVQEREDADEHEDKITEEVEDD